MKKVVVIGGGTGTFVVLSGLKKYALNLSVIVSMMDSGGSTGRLRDQLGVLPPGDLRQCLVALSEAPLLWRQLFLYRFEKGDLQGHNFGNIFLSALEKLTPSYQEVVDTASFILHSKGEVIPVTFDKVHLTVKYEDGTVLKTEGIIDEATDVKSRIKEAALEPIPHPNKKALKAIENSDYIIIGPGDLYTSIVPNLLVPGIKEELQKSKAKIIFVLNLMTKIGQTTHYKGSDFLNDIEKYIGRKVDWILLNNEPIPPEILSHYKEEGERVVIDDIETPNVLRLDLLSKTLYNKSDIDTAVRSLLRHDSDKIAAAVNYIINTT